MYAWMLTVVALLGPEPLTIRQVVETANAQALRITTRCSTEVEPCEQLQIIPVLELSWPESRLEPEDPDSPTLYDVAKTAMATWLARGFETFVVYSRPGQHNTIARLGAEVPGATIIPGIKTHHVLTPFDSLAGWLELGQAVGAMMEASGQRRIHLDHESALRQYVLEEVDIELLLVGEGVRALPDEAEVVWRPVLWFRGPPGGAPGFEKLLVLAQLAQASFPGKMRFEDLRYCAKLTVNLPNRIEAQARLEAAARLPTQPKGYFYGPDSARVWWRDEELAEFLAIVREHWRPDHDVLLYSGIARAVEAAEVLGAQLNPACGEAAR